MAKIFCTENIINKPLEILTKAGHKLEIWDSKINGVINKDILVQKTKNADALICMLSDKIDEEFLSQCPNLKVIAQYAVGFNNIDLKACAKRKIIVTNTPDVLTEATAQMALTLLLACSRNLKQAVRNVENNMWKGWEAKDFLGPELKGKTLGIIGAGAIGQRFMQMCQKAFDMNVIYYQRHENKNISAKYVDLNKLLKESDFLSIHTPLTLQTKNLIKYEQLSLMKDNAIIINTARGEIICEDSLVKCLSEGKFHGIGLDVTYTEPLPINSLLRNYEHVIITPHIGSATYEARTNMATLCAQNVQNVLCNLPPITPITTEI